MPKISSLYLASEKLTFEGDQPIEGEAKVFFRITPSPQVVIEVTASEISEIHAKRLRGEPIRIRLPQRGISAEVVIVSWITSNTTFITAVPCLEPLVTGPSEDPVLVEFQVLNFVDFLGPQGNSLTIVAGEWQIDLYPVNRLPEVVADLKTMGGYDFTHTGKLQRFDKKPFSTASACDVMRALHYFLSFARGFWNGLGLSVGRDNKGDIVWEEWGARHTTSWRQAESWFDPRKPNLLPDVFPGFFDRWSIPLWREPVERVLYWYLGSNIASGGIEGGLILTQAALELLAWVLLVEDKSILSRDGFKRIPAADQIRLLLSALRIPLIVPPELAELKLLCNRLKGVDGPSVLTELRNAFVHPGDRKRAKSASSLACFEAWSLGQWYIELVLLNLCGHNGEYGNRLKRTRWMGDVDPVPWSF